jgi:integrase/recombinase XerD
VKNQIVSKPVKLFFMRSNHTFSIDFITRKCKENKTKAFIYARITVDGELPKEICLKDKIKASDWLNKAEKVKGNSIEAKMINDHIDEVRTKIRAQYKLLLQNDMLITADAVKNAYLGLTSQLKGHALKELCVYYKKIWESKLAPGNFKNYKTTIDYINLFLDSNYQSKDIYLSQLNNQFATDFEFYIRNNPIKDHDPCKGNGVGKHIQRFKRILNWAADEKDGWIKANPCVKYSCPVKKHRRKRLVKWGVAIVAAPETGGASLAVAVAAP